MNILLLSHASQGIQSVSYRQLREVRNRLLLVGGRSNGMERSKSMSTSRAWPFVVILLLSAAIIGTGESQTRPGVVLQIAPALDDSEQNLSLSLEEKRDWLRNHRQ